MLWSLTQNKEGKLFEGQLNKKLSLLHGKDQSRPRARYKPDKDPFLRSFLKAVLKRFVASQKSENASFPRSTQYLQRKTSAGASWGPRVRDPGTPQAPADAEHYILLSRHSCRRAPRRRYPSASASAQPPARASAERRGQRPRRTAGRATPPSNPRAGQGRAAPRRASPRPPTAPWPHCRSPPALSAPRLTAVHLEALMPGSQPIDLALLVCEETLQLPLHRLGQLGELGPLGVLPRPGVLLPLSPHHERRCPGVSPPPPPRVSLLCSSGHGSEARGLCHLQSISVQPAGQEVPGERWPRGSHVLCSARDGAAAPGELQQWQTWRFPCPNSWVHMGFPWAGTKQWARVAKSDWWKMPGRIKQRSQLLLSVWGKRDFIKSPYLPLSELFF